MMITKIGLRMEMEEINLELVTFEQAKRLKEVGYPQLCADYSYLSNGELDEYVEDSDNIFAAPSLELAVKWFREVKHIEMLEFITLIPCDEPKRWNYLVDSVIYHNFDDAMSKCIDMMIVLQIVRNKSNSVENDRQRN